MNRPWIMKWKPLELRQKIFWKYYFNNTSQLGDLFENVSLEFAPHISLTLMSTDVSHQQIAFCGFYELQVSRYIANIAKVGGLMIDVGANYGYYSCIWSATNSRNRVIAFEASPRNLSPLKHNLIRNGLENQVDVHELCVGKESGTLLFDLGPNEQSGWGGLTVHNKMTSIEVLVVSLDEIFLKSEHEHINLLKIDTEGADTWVLQSAEKLLQQHRITHIFFEENLVRMAELGIKAGEAQNLLVNCGYLVKKLKAGEWYATLV
jgi:FkbM family methyltransferase